MLRILECWVSLAVIPPIAVDHSGAAYTFEEKWYQPYVAKLSCQIKH